MSGAESTATFNRRQFLVAGGAAMGFAALAGASPWTEGRAAAVETESGRRPNIIVILADDLGYGELGSFGQTRIGTPHLDRLANEGVRYTDFYAGGPVCAPSRCSMLTGMHSGHATVRNNPDGGGDEPLRDDEVTFALLLQAMGYRTALFGKWGFSPDDPTHPSAPNAQGFDEFFGYLTHIHAHDYYPSYLWDNTARVEITENAGTATGAYAPDLFADRALEFIDAHQSDPFLLLLSTNAPHSPQHVPDFGPYTDPSWSEGNRAHAAQITRMDDHIGRIVQRLEDLGIAQDTVLLFVSDNGPHEEGSPAHDPEFFDANGPLRGYKRNLHEGGIRVPAIMWAPGLVGGLAGGVDDEPWAMWDVLPTLADLAESAVPPFVDGRSMRSTFDAAATPAASGTRPLYWWRLEPFATTRADAAEGGSVRRAAEALRQGDWKALRFAPGRDRTVSDDSWIVELYDLAGDIGESTNVAAQHPEIAASLVALMKAAWVDPPIDRPAWRPDGLTVEAPDYIAAGGTAQVRVTFANHRTVPVTDVTVQLQVPQGWSASPGGNWPTIEPGGAQEVLFEVSAGAATLGSGDLQAQVNALAGTDPVQTAFTVRMQVAPPPPQQTSYLSDLAWLSATNGWGPVERDLSNGRNGAGDGPAISIAGQVYAKGLGVHAPSDIAFYLGGVAERFTSVVGIDDFSANQSTTGRVVFQVWGDGAKLYDSGPVTAAGGPKTLDVATAGVDVLRLVVTDGGNGNGFDHSSWADAMVHVRTVPPVAVEVVAQTRALGSNVYVVVRATNTGDSPIAVTVTTAYGDRDFDAVAAGRNAVVAFNTRASSIPAGDVTVEATRPSDGATRTITASYTARTIS